MWLKKLESGNNKVLTSEPIEHPPERIETEIPRGLTTAEQYPSEVVQAFPGDYLVDFDDLNLPVSTDSDLPVPEVEDFLKPNMINSPGKETEKSSHLPENHSRTCGEKKISKMKTTQETKKRKQDSEGQTDLVCHSFLPVPPEVLLHCSCRVTSTLVTCYQSGRSVDVDLSKHFFLRKKN